MENKSEKKPGVTGYLVMVWAFLFVYGVGFSIVGSTITASGYEMLILLNGILTAVYATIIIDAIYNK